MVRWCHFSAVVCETVDEVAIGIECDVHIMGVHMGCGPWDGEGLASCQLNTQAVRTGHYDRTILIPPLVSDSTTQEKYQATPT